MRDSFANVLVVPANAVATSANLVVPANAVATSANLSSSPRTRGPSGSKMMLGSRVRGNDGEIVMHMSNCL